MALQLLPGADKEVPQHLADKYEAEAARYWDLFYKRHMDKFFKDRHYLDKEFPDVVHGPKVLVEVGCGVGNTVYPLLELNPELRIHACDFSSRAIQLVKEHPGYATGRVNAFVADITADDLSQQVPLQSADFVSMVFVLSAISPEKMVQAIRNVAQLLKPGTGRLLFRDYAEGDLAQDRREGGGARRLSDNFYVRGDGTRCYYFPQDELVRLFVSQGFHCQHLKMHTRDVENRKRAISMHRRWVQAVFTLEQHPSGNLHVESGLQSSKLISASAQMSNTHIPHISQQCASPAPMRSAPDLPTSQPHVLSQQQFTAASNSSSVANYRTSNTSLAGPACGSSADVEMTDAPVNNVGRGMYSDQCCSPSAIGSHQSWLAGAAGRLAAPMQELPGTPGLRTLLPDSLDPADDVAVSLSPAHTPHSARSLNSVAPRPSLHHMEMELEREFFELTSRKADQVVQEEAVAAGICGLRLADPWETAATMHDTHVAPQQATSLASSVPGAVSGRHSSNPQPSSAEVELAIVVSQSMSFRCLCPAGTTFEDHPSLVLARLFAAHPHLLANRTVLELCSTSGCGMGAEYHAGSSASSDCSYSPPTGRNPLPGAMFASTHRRGTFTLSIQDSSAIAAMVAVRYARRVYAAASHHQLHVLANNLELNASRVVIERIKLLHMELGNVQHVAQVKKALQTGCDLIYCPFILSKQTTTSQSFEQLLLMCKSLLTADADSRVLLCYGAHDVAWTDLMAAANSAGYWLDQDCPLHRYAQSGLLPATFSLAVLALS